jgi:ribosome recycling factor
MKLETREYEDKMKKTITSFEFELGTIRAGRANPSVLDKVRIDYFGTMTPVNQMAEIKIPDARTILIQPWDASALKSIEREISAADIGISPQNDGKVIRLSFPQPTEERRKELTKQVAKYGEEAKVALRNIRREANDRIKEMKKKSELTEDEQKNSEKEVQDMTDKFIKFVDGIIEKKDKEIMEI